MGASAGAFERIRSGQENRAQSMRKRHSERYRRRHRHAKAAKHRKFHGQRVAERKHHHRSMRGSVGLGAAVVAGFGLVATLGIGAFTMLPLVLGITTGVGALASLAILACLLPFMWLSASTLLRAAKA